MMTVAHIQPSSLRWFCCTCFKGRTLRIAGPAPTTHGFVFWRARGDRRIRIVSCLSHTPGSSIPATTSANLDMPECSAQVEKE